MSARVAAFARRAASFEAVPRATLKRGANAARLSASDFAIKTADLDENARFVLSLQLAGAAFH